MSEPINNNGELLLPVCIPETEITHLFGALDLYRVLKNEGKSYPAFDAVVNAVGFIDNPQDSPCLDVESTNFNCETFDTFTDAMDFYPNDPFSPSQDAPNLYLEWIRWGDIPLVGDNIPEWLDVLIGALDEDLFGYESNDCLLVPNISTESNPIKRIENLLDNFTNFPLPTVTITVEGAGTVGVEFLNVPLGGRAVVLRDIDISLQEVYEIITDTISPGNEGILNSVSLVELNRDVLSLPPETASTQVQEYEFTEEDTNTIRIIFLPAFNDELPFLFPFGGIRSFRACGNIQVKSISTGDTINRASFREGIIMATKDEICEAIICASEKISQRILLAVESDNIRNGVEINKDTGQTIIKTSQGLTRDDLVVSNRESHYGGVYNQAANVRQFLEDIKAQSSNGFADSVIASLQSTFLNVSEAIRPDVAAFVSGYTASLENITIDTETLALAMFCKDVNQAFVEYAAENHTGAEITILLDALNLIPQSTLDTWYAEGTNVPRTGFESAPCYILNTQELIWDVDNFLNVGYLLPTEQIEQPGNRIKRIEITGRFTGADGRFFDGFYMTYNDGSVVYKPPSFALRYGAPTWQKPPYSPDNGYAITLQFPSNDDNYLTHFYLRNGMQPGQTNFGATTGEIQVKYIDLGQG